MYIYVDYYMCLMNEVHFIIYLCRYAYVDIYVCTYIYIFLLFIVVMVFRDYSN